MVVATGTRAWDIAATVVDPEIPVLTIEDLGVLAVKNPDFYDWSPLWNGQPRPWSHGYHKLPDGTLTPLHSHMGLVVGHDGRIWVTILYPYSLLKIEAIK